MILELPDAPYIRAAQGCGNHTMWQKWGEGEEENGTEEDD